MKMAFHGESCTIVVNIIAELKPVLKIGGSMLFIALLMKRILSIIVLPLNFGIFFFFEKKGLNESFETEKTLF